MTPRSPADALAAACIRRRPDPTTGRTSGTDLARRDVPDQTERGIVKAGLATPRSSRPAAAVAVVNTLKWLTAVAAVGLLVSGALAGASIAPAEAAEPARSVVLIVTDDQRFDTVTPDLTPNIDRIFRAGGAWYPNAFVSNALCCPSRSSILTGNYSHTTGVFANGGENGGADAFRAFANERSTLAPGFDAAGYRTAPTGKFLDGSREVGEARWGDACVV